MNGMRAASLSAILALTLAATALPAGASDICLRLESRLNALDRGGGPDGAIRRQRAQLDRAIEEAREAGCLGDGFFGQRNRGRECARKLGTVERMRARLNRLSDGGGRSRDRERAELVRALAANDCGADYEARRQPSRRDNLLSRLFRGLRLRDRDWPPGDFFPEEAGTFRTLCVRTCDGYYFPVSFSTDSSRFEADEQACQAMCPGTDVRLYVHHNPGEEADAAVSLTGEPYTALPNAFRYRKEYNKACGCGRIATPLPAEPASDASPRSASMAAGLDRTQASEIPPAPVATVRPAPGEDPETLENRAGRLIPRPPGKDGQGPTQTVTAEGKSIRIVGPEFYYGEQD